MLECLGHTQQFSSHLLSTYYMPGTRRKEMQQTKPEGSANIHSPILTNSEKTIHMASLALLVPETFSTRNYSNMQAKTS